MDIKALKILIIDDHRLFADGLAMILSKLDRALDIKSVSNARSVINDLSPSSDYDLIIVDLYMPTLNGFAFLKSIASRRIPIPTIVISSTEDVGDIELAFAHGAKGFIPKNAPTQEMLNGVLQVLDGKLYLPDHLTVNIVSPNTDIEHQNSLDIKKPISGRQLEVLALIKDGHSNSEIAMILDISESTIKGHIAALFKALKVKNRTACVRVAADLELF